MALDVQGQAIRTNTDGSVEANRHQPILSARQTSSRGWKVDEGDWRWRGHGKGAGKSRVS
jgi:hypothetical protein